MILDTLHYYDVAALNAFRSLIDPFSIWQTSAIRFFSDSEVVLTAIVLVAAWFRARFLLKNGVEAKKDALAVFYAVIFAFLLYWILNFSLPARPRPESVSAIAPLIDHLPDNSFPSGHGIFAGSSFVAAYAFFKNKTVALLLLCVGVPMLMARVLAGIHYPGDVTAGFFVWAAFSYLAVRTLSQPSVRDSKLFSVPLAIAAFVRL